VINHVNPLLVVLERLGSADPSKGAFFFWDEVKDWPSGSLDILVTSGFLQPAQPMLNIDCDGCEKRCSNKPVVVYPTQEGKLGRAFIVCDEPEDMGRIKVSFDRMRQWQSNTDAVCGFVATSLGLRRSDKRAASTDLWEIGVATGNKRSQMLCLKANGVLSLVAGNNALPLADFIGHANGAFSLDAVMVRQLVDSANTADVRYTPSTAKREASKFDTQAMYESWSKEYRAQKKKRPNMSDVWYSQQIAKSTVGHGRNASTIKKNMKP